MVEVRPGIRRSLRVVLPIIVVAAAWQVWDNIEARRLQRAIARFDPDDRQQPAALEGNAARLYAAAAMASVDRAASAVPFRSSLDVIRRRREAIAGRVAPLPGDAEQWNTARTQAAVPAMLIDQAAPLPFTSFIPGTEFSYRSSGLINASRLAGATTLAALEQRDVDTAFASLLARIHFLRTLDEGVFVRTQKAQLGQDVATDLALAIRNERLSNEQLQALDDAWARLYSDDELRQAINAMAYAQLDFFGATGGRIVRRNGFMWRAVSPWMQRQAARQLESVAEAMRVSKQPWPQRLNGLAQLDDLTPSFSVRVVTHNLGIGVASFAATTRTTRAALAVERYRREHGRLPASLSELGRPADDIQDPFTGESIKYVVAADGFVVYSVGADGKDDGGHLEVERAKGRGPGVGPLLDIGVRMITKPI